MRPNVMIFGLFVALLAVIGWFALSLVEVQAQPPRRPGMKGKNRDQQKPVELPSDPRLLALHRDFVLKAVKLANEYEKKKDLDKCRAVCEEILKLIPRYPRAQEMLDRLEKMEATAEKEVLDVQANKDWQDTGVIAIADKPLTILANGNWTFKMAHELSPEGMDIPKELRDFKLGSLIGIIHTGDPKTTKPFYVGRSLQFKPKYTGKLYLKMHDSNPVDNVGRVSVEIHGTFEKGQRGG